MQLPRGITGFYHPREGPPPTHDLRVFRGLCHAAARGLGGRVDPVADFAGLGVANFTGLTLEFPSGPVVVLVNLYHPTIAFAEPGTLDIGPITFVDAPALTRQFRQDGSFLVLTAEEAMGPVGVSECELLAEAEREQMRYWKPRKIGEVIFNHWD